MTKDEYARWRNRRDTKRWMEYLQNEMLSEVEETIYHPGSVDRTALETARRAGFVQGVRLALDPPDNLEDDNE